MQLKTILNRVERNKSFVYGKVTWMEKATRPTLEVQILPRANGRALIGGTLNAWLCFGRRELTSLTYGCG